MPTRASAAWRKRNPDYDRENRLRAKMVKADCAAVAGAGSRRHRRDYRQALNRVVYQIPALRHAQHP